VISLPSQPNGEIGDRDEEPLIQSQIIAEEQTGQDLAELNTEPISSMVGAVEKFAEDHSSSASTTAKPTLSAMFLKHNTVSDGQVFPPGAEFVKCWRMLNDGVHDWPEATEIVFAAGDSLALDDAEPQRIKVGVVASGSKVNVWTGELKVSNAAL
jgi:hypothetical protein